MGRVYKVALPVVGKIAALKVLYPNPTLLELLGIGRLRYLFIEEAKVLASFRHPNIAEIWSFGEVDGRPHYLMDYYCNNVGMMIGETYRVENPTRKLPVEWSLRYAHQCLEGLACLHEAGLVHRDIKPYNLLLTDLDTVKICDFGLSKFRGESFSGPPQLKVGTPGYAAPEQAEDPDRVDGSADTYSVGVLLYRMITGHLPGDAPEMERFPQPVQADGAPPLQWDDFFHKALHRNPGERFTSAAGMLTGLTKLADAWRKQEEAACREDRKAEHRKMLPSPTRERIREDCRKVLARNARETFQTDRLMRPRSYVRNAFRLLDEEWILDEATGRTWQRSGSMYPVTWPEAKAYVNGLNRKADGGFSDWRLPTIPELMTLLELPSPDGAWCMRPLFDRRQNRLWSCDRRSFNSAWFISVDIGFLAWQDMTGYYYVRAVRSSMGSSPPSPIDTGETP
jgi:serine/threonine-protein kinase